MSTDVVGMGEERTFADGGSATSQASESEHGWEARPLLAWTLRILVALAPIAASFTVTRIYGRLVAIDTMGAPAYWAGLLVLAVATAFVTQRRAQALLPLVALFKMSLVFPDRAPSRFGVALRSGSTARLRERAEANGDADAATDLLVLVKALSKHDPLTRGHSERVRAYSDLIAQELGLSTAERNRLAWGALAHDVGKLDVRPSTLNKPGRPTADEWDEIRNHPAAAAHRMAPLDDWLGDWTLAASQHHERWDGQGYPLGLKGLEISLAGRIVAVADAYDVMTSTRSYKKALSPEAAREELINNADTQFDPIIVRAFLQIGIQRLTLAGPLAWLSELAWFARIPQTVSQVGTTAVSTAATATVAISATVVSAPIDATPPPLDEFSSERVVESVEEVPEPIEVAGTRAVAPTTTGAPIELTPLAIPESTTTTTSSSSTTTTSSPTSTTAAPATTAPTTNASPTTTIAGRSADVPTTTSTTTVPTTIPPTTTRPAASTTTTVTPTTTSTTTTTVAPATTTTTTTLPPTTTTTLPVSDFRDPAMLEGHDGDHVLSLDAPLIDGPLGNYDSHRNGDPGLTLKRKNDLADAATNDDYHQHFGLDADDGFVLDGTPSLEIWAAIKNYNDKTGVVYAELLDCDFGAWSCIELGTARSSFEQDDFGDAFGRVELEFDPIGHQVDPGRTLILNLYTHPDSDAHLWFAFGTTTYPAAFQVR